MAAFEDVALPLMPSAAGPAPVSRRQAAEAIAEHFADLERAARRVAEAGEALAEEVASARAAGFSWQDVGEALGIDRETARRRYGAA